MGLTRYNFFHAVSVEYARHLLRMYVTDEFLVISR